VTFGWGVAVTFGLCLAAPLAAAQDVSRRDEAVSLRDYVEQHFAADDAAFLNLRRELAAALEAAKDVVTTAVDGINSRLATIEARVNVGSERLIALEGQTTRISINTQIIENLGSRLTAIESGGSPIAVRNETDLQRLTDRVTAIESKGAGVSQTWTVASAAAGLIFGAIMVWLAIRPHGQPPKMRGA
jgi:hypothetical protein